MAAPVDRIRDRTWPGLAWGFAGAVVVVWGVFAFRLDTGEMTLPHARLIMLAVPAALCALPLIAPWPVPQQIVGAALGMLAVSIALLLTPYITANPRVAVGGLVAVLAGPLCARFPAAATLAALGLAAFSGSFQAFTTRQAGPYADLILAGLWVGLLWRLATGRRPGPAIAPFGLMLLIGYGFVSAAQVLTAPTIDIGMESFHHTAWYVLVAALVAFSGWSSETFERITKGVAAVALAVGGYAVLRMIVGPAGSEVAQAFSTPVNFFLSGELGLFGSFFSRHQLSAWGGIAIPFLAVLAVDWRGRWRWVALAACALCALALFRTEVRAGFVGALLGLGVVPLRAYGRSTSGLRLGTLTAAISAALAIGAVAFLLGVPQNPIERGRYTAILHPATDEAYRARTEKWDRILDDLGRHPWGHGLGSAGQIHLKSARVVTIASQPIDNSYLLIAYQQGIWVAFLFGSGLVILLIGMTHRALSTTDPRRASIALASSAGLASFIFILYTGDYAEASLLTLLPWTLAGIGAAQYREAVPVSAPPRRQRPATAAADPVGAGTAA